MSPTLSGIHHVTAITTDVQRNIDFYCGVLGLRLVKLTVNFDDPERYHVYYGDYLGRPGTLLTFFGFPGVRPGQVGPPQVSVVTFVTPNDSLDFWSERLRQYGVALEAKAERFGQEVLRFRDPDGMRLELLSSVITPPDPVAGPIGSAHAIVGLHGVTILEEGYEKTAKVLTELMGFQEGGRDGNRFRFHAPGEGLGSAIDLVCAPDAARGSVRAGSVHHVAFRARDEEQQKECRSQVSALGLNVSPVMDRSYFHSIYFREPGGVLFEIATDGPGFAVDEPIEALGSSLRLPPQYEPSRPELEELLPPLRLPAW